MGCIFFLQKCTFGDEPYWAIKGHLKRGMRTGEMYLEIVVLGRRWGVKYWDSKQQASKRGTRRRKPCTFQIRLNRKKRWTGRPQTLKEEESETWVTEVASLSHIQLHDQIVLFQPLFLNLILRKIFWVISTPTGSYQASHIQQAQSLIARTIQRPTTRYILEPKQCQFLCWFCFGVPILQRFCCVFSLVLHYRTLSSVSLCYPLPCHSISIEITLPQIT